MEDDGEWGGNLELQAAAKYNVVVHQLGAPKYEIANFPTREAKGTMHLAYHDELHYDAIEFLSEEFKALHQVQSDSHAFSYEDHIKEYRSEDDDNNDEEIEQPKVLSRKERRALKKAEKERKREARKAYLSEKDAARSKRAAEEKKKLRKIEENSEEEDSSSEEEEEIY
eukprot:CAMPEP_0117430980 /NCGR_PEP_ID=MMETSP0758-20121206/10541_1 /TAXON_ID=63605 /ORGANISM="Percolomonas cosmopolitus, Strain AE-1 (ATCC 50343)" /LENGTH=168 /DNA_ID=CAMNT_0005219585 /DNA_START=157 /DNA_END=660 /DNA_ORIENTATION=-